MLLRSFENHRPCSSFLRSLSSRIQDVFTGLDKDPDRLSVAAKVVIQEYRDGNEAVRTGLLTKLAQECGVRHEALVNAIHLYSKNPAMVHEVQAASCPVHYHLLRSVGNQMDGIKLVCEIRANLLALIKTTEEKQLVSTLRRLEESARDLLTTWFCLSNLKLNRLTWQSPGDILHKIAEYEAVHPVRGLVDFRTRIGPLRRCFYFTHEAMPREPLVMIHVALMKKIGDSVQEIVSGKASSGEEDEQTTAIYYSITSTQKGLAGIDLGNLLIKQVAAQITREVPTVQTHSTLSPMPGFRSWLIRSLKGHSEFGDLINEKVLSLLAKTTGGSLSREKGTDLLLQAISNEKISPSQLKPLRDLLLHFAARYLYESKRNGFTVNPVANFHLRNGAELYRLNWLADTSFRGISNSLGIMVNYRYYLDRVAENSSAYTHQKVIQTDQQVLSLL